MDDNGIARMSRALGHPARLRILRLLAAQDSCMGGEIFSELPLAQSTISRHLAVLKDASLVHATPRGTSMVYCITAAPLGELARELELLVTAHPVCTGKES